MKLINLTLNAVLIFLSIIIFQNCSNSPKTALPNWQEKPYESLSEYGFFSGDLKELIPNKDVLPYDLNTPLFSDYSQKLRFVWMPEGTSANYDSAAVLDFPKGTVLIKNFFYSNDKRNKSKGRRLMETRLLINKKDKWDALTYIWNEDQTEATLDIVGDVYEVNWVNEIGEQIKNDYIVPNKNQCKGCHDLNGKLTPIGPKAGNLNRDFVYDSGTKNQLEKWSEIGYLSGFNSKNPKPKFAVWNNPESGTLHERAMAYLEVNCGHCHNADGPGNTSGLHLTYSQPKNLKLGIFKAPVATGKGSGGRNYNIVPGKPENSILLYRMESTDPGAMMPEVGRSMVHEEGVELIREWIKEMGKKM